MEDQLDLPPWMTEFIALAPRARAMLLRELGSALLWTLIALPFLWMDGERGVKVVVIGALAGVTAIERHWPAASAPPPAAAPASRGGRGGEASGGGLGETGRGLGGALVAIVGQTLPLLLLVTDVLTVTLTLGLWAAGAVIGVDSAFLLAAGSGTACFASATFTLLLRQLLTPPVRGPECVTSGVGLPRETGQPASGRLEAGQQEAGRPASGRPATGWPDAERPEVGPRESDRLGLGSQRQGRWLVLLGVVAGWGLAIAAASALLDAAGPWWLVAAGFVFADLAALLALRLGRREPWRESRRQSRRQRAA